MNRPIVTGPVHPAEFYGVLDRVIIGRLSDRRQ
jgi:hypothetical protein